MHIIYDGHYYSVYMLLILNKTNPCSKAGTTGRIDVSDATSRNDFIDPIAHSE